MNENENRFGQDPETTELHKIETGIATIEQMLRQNTSAEKAAEIIRQVFETAIKINEINTQILSDPSVVKNYIRDENLLIKINNPNFHANLPDASHLLKSFDMSASNRPDRFIKWLNDYTKIAEARLAYLQETGDITLIDKDLVKEIVQSEKGIEKDEIKKYFDNLIDEEKDEDSEDR